MFRFRNILHLIKDSINMFLTLIATKYDSNKAKKWHSSFSIIYFFGSSWPLSYHVRRQCCVLESAIQPVPY